MGPEVAFDAGVFVRLYDLTEIEAALAAHLMQGESIDAAAAALSVSPHIARMYLKGIFKKTEARGQAELVRTLSAVS